MISRVWPKLLVSTALLTWLLARTPFDSLAREFARFGLGTVLLGAALSVAAWLLSALRLRCIAPEFRLAEVARMTFIGLFYGTVLPGQIAGDVVKAYRLSRSQQFPGHAVAATLVDRGIALLALFVLGAAAAFQVRTAPAELRVALCVASAGLALAATLLAMPVLRNILNALTRITEGRATRLAAFLEGVADALRKALLRPGRMALSMLLAFVFHLICVAIQIVLGERLGIALTPAAWCLVYAGVSAALLLPITVAGIGLREGSYVMLLALFGVSRESALALSLVFLGYTLFGALLGGVIELRYIATASRPIADEASTKAVCSTSERHRRVMR